MARERIPPGIKLVRYILRRSSNYQRRCRKTYKLTVLALTFIAHACYHLSRRPPAVVKSVLHPETHVPGTGLGSLPFSYHDPWPLGKVFVPREEKHTFHGTDAKGRKKKQVGWAPFDERDGMTKLGMIDLAFLVCYPLGMYAAGHLGDRLDLRIFLAIGMVASGGVVCLFGMGYFWDLHLLWYYVVMQMLAGLLQATGLPSMVAVMGNWLGESKRGLIMGLWNASASVGNICGTLTVVNFLQYGWGWGFILPGGLSMFGGVLLYLFLVPYPEDLGFSVTNWQSEGNAGEDVGDSTGGDIRKTERARRGSAVGLKEAFSIPGVVMFSIFIFFSKLVACTFLHWLPFYLVQTEIGGERMSVKCAGNLSTLFDMGGILGGILAGLVSDLLNARAITAVLFIYLAIPVLLVYFSYGGGSRVMNIIFMIIAGACVNGPYALITTAVSADLGTHGSLREDIRALATVAAFIDGTGSVAAALAPLFLGLISQKEWRFVFIILMSVALVAGFPLLPLVCGEIRQLINRPLNSSSRNSDCSTEQPRGHTA